MHSCYVFSILKMVSVLYWEPTTGHEYGHVALQTDKYHMSLWPCGSVKERGALITATSGIQATLNFHHDYDKELEGHRNPTNIIDISCLVSKTKLNEIYETILRYNGINPADVTLEKGDALYEEHVKPEVELTKTLYSYLGVHYTSETFYKNKQSCTTFATGLILSSSINNRFRNRLLRYLETRGRQADLTFGVLSVSSPSFGVFPSPLNLYKDFARDAVDGILETGIFVKIITNACENDNDSSNESSCVLQ